MSLWPLHIFLSLSSAFIRSPPRFPPPYPLPSDCNLVYQRPGGRGVHANPHHFEVRVLLENIALTGSWLERRDFRVQSRHTEWGFGWSFLESVIWKVPIWVFYVLEFGKHHDLINWALFSLSDSSMKSLQGSLLGRWPLTWQPLRDF